MSAPLPLRSVPMQHILNPLQDKTAFLDARDALVAGLNHHGLVYLHFPPHDLPDYRAIVPPAFHQSRQFFASPLAEKSTAIPPALPQGVTRGYLPTAAESGGNTPESKEIFSWSVDVLPPTVPRPFEHPNIWPSTHTHAHARTNTRAHLRPSFNALFNYLHSAMLAVNAALDPLVPSHALEHIVKHGRSVSLARAFIYHPTDTALPNATGSVEHTDWGLATILTQQPHSLALEVMHDGEWRSVRGRADTLIFAAGDFLSLASRGMLKSPKHRVVLTPTQRLSFGFFQYPPYATSLPDMIGLDAVTNKLSLFVDQRPGASGRLSGKREDGSPLSFGELLIQKWDHVSRA